MLYILYKISYEKGDPLCNNLYHKLEIACMYCNGLVVILGKDASFHFFLSIAHLSKTSYYLLWPWLLSIKMLCAWMGFRLLALYVITCYLAKFVKLTWFFPIELHCRVVSLSSHIRFKGIYNQVIAKRLLICMFVVVLAGLVKGW